MSSLEPPLQTAHFFCFNFSNYNLDDDLCGHHLNGGNFSLFSNSRTHGFALEPVQYVDKLNKVCTVTRLYGAKSAGLSHQWKQKRHLTSGLSGRKVYISAMI
jgi:hypothetical protein